MSISALRAQDSANPEQTEHPAEPRLSINDEILRGVRVSIEVRLGTAKMTVSEMLALKLGSVVTLESALSDHAELYLNNMLVARGEIVAVGDKFGVRIVEIVPTS
jgi:flagellar motor switch protein FliN/FliY